MMASHEEGWRDAVARINPEMLGIEQVGILPFASSSWS